MAYDHDLAERLREALATEAGVTERAMFGGLGFMIHGNMAVAASSQGGLLLRVDPAETAQLLEHEHASPFQMQGRPMSGWLHVAAAAADDDAEFGRWVRLGIERAKALPPK